MSNMNTANHSSSITICSNNKKNYQEMRVLSFEPTKNHQQESINIQLQHGGEVSLFKNLLTPDEMAAIQHLVHNDTQQEQTLRKYKVGGIPEPRLHMMYSSKVPPASDNNNETSPTSNHNNNNAATGPGYHYHGVNMRAMPLSSIPILESIASRLATKFGVDEWGIGVEVILYRDGKDKIGKHADDTQGETLILSTVAQTDISRVIKIEPKEEYKGGKAGEEEITLTVNEGDGYVMDGEMQAKYVHWVPAVESCNTPRIALIFRQGLVKEVKDNGKAEIDLNPSMKRFVEFGHPVEGSNIQVGSVVGRDKLYHYNAHYSMFGGVSGNKEKGCCSIIVSNQDPARNERDFFREFYYSASITQGSPRLKKTFALRQVIRVFRSSKCKMHAAKVPPGVKNGTSTVYRYDGLYIISSFEEYNQNKGKKDQYTLFHMGKVELKEGYDLTKGYNHVDNRGKMRFFVYL